MRYGDGVITPTARFVRDPALTLSRLVYIATMTTMSLSPFLSRKLSPKFTSSQNMSQEPQLIIESGPSEPPLSSDPQNAPTQEADVSTASLAGVDFETSLSGVYCAGDTSSPKPDSATDPPESLQIG